MLKSFLSLLFVGLVTSQPAFVFTDTARNPIVGNYTIGYVNNTVENPIPFKKEHINLIIK